MDNIQIFPNKEFGNIRVIVIDGEPWFVGKDVATALGYARPENAVTDNTDKEDRLFLDKKLVLKLGISFDYKELGQRGGWIVNESGMYALVFGSKLESARNFKKWVTSKVLPSIRKTGTYGQPQLPSDPMEMLKIHYAALEQVDKKVDAVDGKVGQLESRITDLEDTMTLDHGQEYYIEKTVNKTVITALGGKDSNAYKQIGRKVFAECNGDLKAYFKVNARGNVPRKRYEEAVTYAENWKPCTNTQMLIDQHNAQQRLDV